jgi:A/G-specific adenine glycosylase
VVTARGEAEGEWWPIERIEEAGLPTLFTKAAALVRARAGTEELKAA